MLVLFYPLILSSLLLIIVRIIVVVAAVFVAVCIVAILICTIGITSNNRAAGIAQWLERRTRDRKVAVRIPAGAAGEFSSPGSTFCADSYFGIPSTPVLPQ